MIKLLVSFQLNIFKIKMHLQIAYFESYFFIKLEAFDIPDDNKNINYFQKTVFLMI